MSDRDSNHTVVLDIDVPLPSVIRKISRTLNVEVEEDSIVPRKKKGNGTPVATSVKYLITPLFKGPMWVKPCKISVEMAHIMVSLISKQFTMTAKVTMEPLVQMSAYFAHTGIHHEEYLSFMTNYVAWPPPQTIATTKQKMNLISIPDTILLSKITSYTVAL